MGARLSQMKLEQVTTVACTVTGSVADLHSFIANLAWVYWYGHIGMALLHEILGHRVLARIFLLRR